VRFLPQYDNLLLAHADRTHVTGDAPGHWPTDGLHWSPLLVDGVVGGAWRLTVDRGAATLVVEPLGHLPDPAAVAAEGARLLALLAPDAERQTISGVPD
jgi:Winged helix DNA-binding domain